MNASTHISVAVAIGAALAVTAMVIMSAVSSAGPGTRSGISVVNPWAAETIGAGRNTAIYLTLHNTGDDDELVGASSPQSSSSQLHATVFEGETTRMRPVHGIPIPSGSTVSLAPGGYHLMLTDLSAPLVPGQEVRLVLEFKDGDSIMLNVPVRSREDAMRDAEEGDDAAEPDGHNHH